MLIRRLTQNQNNGTDELFAQADATFAVGSLVSTLGQNRSISLVQNSNP